MRSLQLSELAWCEKSADACMRMMCHDVGRLVSCSQAAADPGHHNHSAVTPGAMARGIMTKQEETIRHYMVPSSLYEILVSQILRFYILLHSCSIHDLLRIHD